MSFYSDEELHSLGFKSVGCDVKVSKKASLYGIERIAIGSHVRIDDFCVLSAGAGGMVIGDYVHIAVFASLIGQGQIYLADFCSVSSRVSIYSSNDDYSGAFLTNPTVPTALTNVTSADVILHKHVIIGSGSVILPGVTIGMGASIGALSLIARDCQAFGVYSGNPARHMMNRSMDLLALEQTLRNS
ncbi:acyltransferase [Shewanella sp. NIFS-20-20]|uniref:acyltransferase n=1 Tax=Shewanella sp. NIFS-20-20 TaxID=2853806 RepID=UPI001C461F83|nr:acyltransferase [Shewanella sp. NIFS-20-20]MBV7316377.1 acyltransferase [Shewanella sp. NIFS-20-20]